MCYLCKMMLIDTHTHLYASQFDEDREPAIQAAKDLGVGMFLLPNIDSTSISGLKKLSEMDSSILPMMGLHPCSVNESLEEELEIIEKELNSETNYIAIGEIGMDLYWDKTFIKEQEYAFRKQIDWAKERNLPIAIHCREAFDEILTVLDEVNDEKLFGVFHCFTGTLDQAQHILSYGNFKLGIGGVVTFKNGGLDKVLPHIDIDDIILETDAPYLAPSPFRGKRNESKYLLNIAQKLADIYQIPLDALAEKTSNNARQLFNLNYESA